MTKAELVGQMMLRPNGVSNREATAATGWPSISLPQQARACGLTFTKRREGGEVRYFARRSIDDLVMNAVSRIDNMVIARGGRELGEVRLHELRRFLLKLIADAKQIDQS